MAAPRQHKIGPYLAAEYDRNASRWVRFMPGWYFQRWFMARYERYSKWVEKHVVIDGEFMVQPPKMYYFGPYNQAGHFFFGPRGSYVSRQETECIPWKDYEIDGKLQPGCFEERGHWSVKGPEIEGQALLWTKNGWTAISFWDRSVDTRGRCNSTFIAEGTFTFEEMVEWSKLVFPDRWARMKFEVVQSK